MNIPSLNFDGDGVPKLNAPTPQNWKITNSACASIIDDGDITITVTFGSFEPGSTGCIAVTCAGEYCSTQIQPFTIQTTDYQTEVNEAILKACSEYES